ncbi:hypothetical protein [Isoptericola sp. BMS4]|uniref:hypothetical protein n=1 Tax=Isoptericola sp. BMS4 TaxID=2527875 RepID=UPI001420174B|nr:hypothetical protein [Isoptericola sp. BMS4]
MSGVTPAQDPGGTSPPSPDRVSRRWRTVTVVLGALLALAAAGCVAAGLTAVEAQDRADALAAELSDAADDRDAAQGRAEAAEGRIAGAEARADEAEQAAADREAELDERESGLDEREKELDGREKAVGKAEQRQAETRITEGTWTVGDDVEPGTYRTTESVSGDCYWAIYRSGTNQGDIVQNDIVTGGHPTVSLSDGQDFETNRCGTWDKQ